MNAEFLKLEWIMVRVEEGAGGSASLPNGSAGNEGLFIVMQLGFPCNTGVSKEDLLSASYQGCLNDCRITNICAVSQMFRKYVHKAKLCSSSVLLLLLIKSVIGL